MRKIVRSVIFIFILFPLLITPITAEVEPLGVKVEIPSFYEMNLSGAEGNTIGVAGGNYLVKFTVSSTSKEMDLTNRYLKVTFTYFGSFHGQSVFCYKNYFEEKTELTDTFNLSNLSTDQLNGNLGVFRIAFLEPGAYLLQWNEIVGTEELKPGTWRRISIVEPYEYEALLKQSQVLDAEKESAEAAINSSKASERTANAMAMSSYLTAFLAFFTLLVVLVSYCTLKQIQKDREVDLLRKRLENLYSMLRFNKRILERYNPSPRADGLSQEESDFYREVRSNLYLGSDDLVAKAKKLLDLIEEGGTLEGKSVEDDELKNIKKDLIDQIDLDYEKYLGRLIELTEKPKKWWNIRARILRKS